MPPPAFYFSRLSACSRMYAPGLCCFPYPFALPLIRPAAAASAAFLTETYLYFQLITYKENPASLDFP